MKLKLVSAFEGCIRASIGSLDALLQGDWLGSRRLEQIAQGHFESCTEDQRASVAGELENRLKARQFDPYVTVLQPGKLPQMKPLQLKKIA